MCRRWGALYIGCLCAFTFSTGRLSVRVLVGAMSTRGARRKPVLGVTSRWTCLCDVSRGTFRKLSYNNHVCVIECKTYIKPLCIKAYKV